MMAHDHPRSSEMTAHSESMILEPFIQSARNVGLEPPSDISFELCIQLLARNFACSAGVYSRPQLIDFSLISMCDRKHQCYPCYIGAAFRSTNTNEVFMFSGFHYFVVKYNDQSYSQKEAIVTKSPLLLFDGFPKLFESRKFRDFGVDAAFGCHGTKEAFLFSMFWYARIKYNSDNVGEVIVLETIDKVFKSLQDTVFSAGYFDAACESFVLNHAYLFKGSDYALVDYSDEYKFVVIKEGRITDEFTCLCNTPFESDIESAFASHKSNHFYFFKGNNYVLIEFDSEAKESHIIAGPEEIVPTNWPCLASYLPYRKCNYPRPIQPKTWEPSFDSNGCLVCLPLANGSPEANVSERKRKVEDYALDSSGSSSKFMKTVEGGRLCSNYIDAAFRSMQDNEFFMFSRHKYFVVKYDAVSGLMIQVTEDPLLLADGFKELSETRFCTHGVDAAFGCYGTDTAFLFSGNWAVKIKYDLNIYEGRLVGLKDEVEGGVMPALFWFPGLIKGTKLFCEGYLDAACESTVPGEAYLFKGSCYALIDYSKSFKLIREGSIVDEFTCLRNTVYESWIGTAFASHNTSNQLYFLKDDTYVLIEFDSETRASRIIAGPLQNFHNLLEYKMDIGSDSYGPNDGQKLSPS